MYHTETLAFQSNKQSNTMQFEANTRPRYPDPQVARASHVLCIQIDGQAMHQRTHWPVLRQGLRFCACRQTDIQLVALV